MTKKLLLATAILGANLLYAEHWGYTGAGAPENWAKIDKKSFMCAEGSNQSPINLTGFTESELPAIGFNYNLNSSKILNNGHTVQVDITNGSSITVDDIVFDLKQFHFHTPSENNINGNSYPLEAHFVHASKNGELAVVAVMFEEGEENEALTELWAKMPAKKGDTHSIDAKALNALLPKDRDYYRFNGSLTTPPCTEGVRWLVMKKPLSISKSQIASFATVVHGHNNRPVQATNARAILQ